MTIDERIEKLTRQQEAGDQRQKALDESIGELVAIGRRTDERLDRLTERQEAQAMTVELHGRDMREWTAKVEPLIVNLADAMTQLAKITESHEHRITHLEGGAQA